MLAVVLSAIHVGAARLRFLDVIPRSRWLSIAGGISVAYVVVHLLPELAEYQEHVGEAVSGVVVTLERHVYLVALLGLVAFYGVERLSRSAHGGSEEAPVSGSVASWFSFVTYAVYNAVIGYLLTRRGALGEVILFALAMGLHFLVNDYGLRQHHPDSYLRHGRWILSSSVLLGAAVGYLFGVPATVIGVAIAFIGGGTILNVLKEELPESRQSRFGAFFGGAAAYTLLLLAV